MAKRSTSTRSRSKQIGEILRSAGVVTDEQLDDAVAYKQERGVKLGQALIELGFVEEEELVRALKDQGRFHCIELSLPIVDREVAVRLNEDFARKRHVVVVNEIAGVVTVAMDDPTDVYTVDDVSHRLGKRVQPVYARSAQIDDCLLALYPEPEEGGDRLNAIVTTAEIGGQNLKLDEHEITDDIEYKGEDHPVVRLIRGVMLEALQNRSSDIHLETRAETFVVRYRVDGSLFDRLTLPRSWSRPCISRLKVMSNLDIAQRRLPQDGRAQVEIAGRKVDLRVASSPTLRGESCVIRILDGGQSLQSVDSLGVTPEQIERMRRIVHHREGFMLATGPTGSGKTTTLYALLQELHTPDKKIITLEDPVEHHVDGISQINTHAKSGLTFARGLRSILRQDPDIVLVGEIRDQETAEIAVQASLTGHMVLSTLHTVGSAESVTRLKDIGIQEFLLADTLRGIVAQRLVRRICEDCKEAIKVPAELTKRLGVKIKKSQTFHVGEGCEKCHGTGFYGRLGLFEILVVTTEIADAMRQGANTGELRRAAMEAGMTTLRQEGVKKALEGLTTVEEVLATTMDI